MGLTNNFKSVSYMGDGVESKIISMQADIRKLRNSFILLEGTLNMLGEPKKRKRAHGCIAKCDGILDRLMEIQNELVFIDTK